MRCKKGHPGHDPDLDVTQADYHRMFAADHRYYAVRAAEDAQRCQRRVGSPIDGRWMAFDLRWAQLLSLRARQGEDMARLHDQVAEGLAQ